MTLNRMTLVQHKLLDLRYYTLHAQYYKLQSVTQSLIMIVFDQGGTTQLSATLSQYF